MRVLLRLRFILLLIALFFLAVEARLAHLQFTTREFWEREATATREGGRTIPFQRGTILDRHSRRLASSTTVHSLVLLPGEFRKKTPLGQLGAALKIVFGSSDGESTPALGIRDLTQRPDDFVKRVLDLHDRDLEPLPKYLRDDLLFYVRGLLHLSETEFRAARAQAEGRDAAFGDFVDGARARASREVRDHYRGLIELERAIEAKTGELIDAIEDETTKVEGLIQNALVKEGVDPATRAGRSIRKDFESRERTLVDSIPYPAVCLVNVVPDRYLGFEVSDLDRRDYPPQYQDLSPVLIGWVGPPTDTAVAETERDRLRLRELTSKPPEELDLDSAQSIDYLRTRLRESDYLPDEEQGRTGLEGLLEPVLRGRRGWRIVEQDRARNDTRLVNSEKPVQGLAVKLTLDAELQRAAERVLEQIRHPGAIVLLDPSDGAIRALASWPTVTRERVKKDYDVLAKDRNEPLANRCYRPPGNPPAPGSVFKIVALAAALESGKIGPSTHFTCNYALPVDSKNVLHCDSKVGHGSIGLADAFAKSCNVWFYEAGAITGFEALKRTAEQLGFARATGFGDAKRLGLGAESIGIGEMACKLNQERVSRVYVMRSAIGQGAFDDMTPLQVAQMPCAIANGGKAVRPYLVDVIGGDAAPRESPAPLGWKTSTITTLRECMIAVCAPGGTAGLSAEKRPFDLRRFKVAGKTGTAQVQGAQTHAWFAGYFPHDRPQLAFCVFFENVGKHGGDFAAPVLNQLLEQAELESYR